MAYEALTPSIPPTITGESVSSMQLVPQDNPQSEIEEMKSLYGITNDEAKQLVRLKHEDAQRIEAFLNQGMSRGTMMRFGLSALVLIGAASVGIPLAGRLEQPERIISTGDRIRNLLVDFSQRVGEKFELTSQPLIELPGAPRAVGRHVVFDLEHLEEFKHLNPHTAFSCSVLGTDREIFFGYNALGEFEAANVERISKKDDVSDYGKALRMVLNPEDYDTDPDREVHLQYRQAGLDDVPTIAIPQGFYPRELTKNYIPVDFERSLTRGVAYKPVQEIYDEVQKYSMFAPDKTPPPVVVAAPETELYDVVEEYNMDSQVIKISASSFEFPGKDMWSFQLIQGMMEMYFANIHSIMEENPDWYYDPRVLDYTWEHIVDILKEEPYKPIDDLPREVEPTVFNALLHPGTYDRQFSSLRFPMTIENAASGLLFIAQNSDRVRELSERFKSLEVAKNSGEELEVQVFDSDTRSYLASLEASDTQQGAARYLLNPIYNIILFGTSSEVSDVASEFFRLPENMYLRKKELRFDPWAPPVTKAPFPLLVTSVSREFGPPPYTPIDESDTANGFIQSSS